MLLLVKQVYISEETPAEYNFVIFKILDTIVKSRIETLHNRIMKIKFSFSVCSPSFYDK